MQIVVPQETIKQSIQSSILKGLNQLNRGVHAEAATILTLMI